MAVPTDLQAAFNRLDPELQTYVSKQNEACQWAILAPVKGRSEEVIKTIETKIEVSKEEAIAAFGVKDAEATIAVTDLGGLVITSRKTEETRRKALSGD